MCKYIDAHCHIGNFPPIFGAGIVGAIINSTCQSDWAALIDISMHSKNIYPAIGVHPWFAHSVVPGWDSELENLIRMHPTLMLGEIGLDRMRGNMDTQIHVFLRQINIASCFKRTAHIHCVRAWDKMLNVLSHVAPPPVLVFHACRANGNIMRELIRHSNAYFSYGPKIDAKVRQSIENAPLNRILVETDAIIGGTEYPDIQNVVKQISEIKDIDNTEMADIIYNNTLQVIKNG